MKNSFLFLPVLILFSLSACNNDRPQQQSSTETSTTFSPMYIGTYTKKEGHVDGQGKGIYLLNKNEENGYLEFKSTAAELDNPSFVAVSPDKKNLYAVSELTQADGPNGFVFAYKINEDNSLDFLQKITSGAHAPCHISLDHKGQYVFTANYLGGFVKMYKRMPDGTLNPTDSIQLTGSGPHAHQESSHAHAAIISPENNFLFVCDLGSDKIWNFKIDHSTGTLDPNQQPFMKIQPGAGPRHFKFHPNGKYAYVINELDNTVNAFSYDGNTGTLTDIQSISTLPEGFEETSYCADIHVHPNGRFLYGSNRGHDSIVAFEIDEDTGKLTLVGHESTRGDVPRNFAVDSSGRYLYAANQNSDNIVLFNIDKKTGKLTYSGHTLEVNTPVCVHL